MVAIGEHLLDTLVCQLDVTRARSSCSYPGSTFMDHVMRYENNDDVKMIVLLGEVGGTEEYKIVQVLERRHF